MQGAAGQCVCILYVCLTFACLWIFKKPRMRASAWGIDVACVPLSGRGAAVCVCVWMCSSTACKCVWQICEAANTWGRGVLPAYWWASIAASLPLSPAQTQQPTRASPVQKLRVTFSVAVHPQERNNNNKKKHRLKYSLVNQECSKMQEKKERCLPLYFEQCVAA